MMSLRRFFVRFAIACTLVFVVATSYGVLL